MSAQSQLDGGRLALAGFLYQIVGLLGLSARARAIPTSEDDPDLDALVTLVKNGRLLHEAYGQDAVVATVVGGEAGLSLVQFKYSRRDPPRPMSRSEYDGIVRRLANSEELAEGLGKRVTGFYLITNRDVPPSTAVAKSGAAASERSRTKRTRKGVKKPSSAISTGPREARIRAELKILRNVRHDHWIEGLRQFAAQFGCLDQDIERGIQSLLGSVTMRTAEAGDVVVEEETLVKAFTQFRSTKRITLESLRDKSVEQITSFSDRLGHPGAFIRRKLLDELSRAVAQRALVVLEGLGGCGKTTTLAAWALEVLESPSPRPGALMTIACISDISPSWIREVVCDGAGIPRNGHDRRTETVEIAIDRLAAANPSALRPILLLGLDGLDEGEEYADRRRAVREVLEWFWIEDRESTSTGRCPIATGIVTCRDQKEVISRLNLDLAGSYSRDGEPAIISVGDFTLRELLEAARKDYAEAYARFHTSVEHLGRPIVGSADSHPEVQLLELPEANGAPISAEILETLCHPVMWRSLLYLESEVRERALDGETEATRALARAFTERWFCTKVQKRNLNLSDADILRILGRVAQNCRDAGQTYTYQADWCESALSTKLISDHQARHLYNEAVSAGYVQVSERGRWRWRHRVCVDYLASAEIPE